MMDLQSLSFIASPLVQVDDALVVFASDSDSILLLLCSRIDNLYVLTEKLRIYIYIVEENHNLTGRVHSLGVEVDLFGDNIGCDPCLTNVPLRSAWKGISWVKSFIADNFQATLPQLRNISPPLSIQEVQRVIYYALLLSSTDDFDINAKVAALESSPVTYLPRLIDLYSVYSGGVSKKPMKHLLQDLIRFHNNFQSSNTILFHLIQSLVWIINQFFRFLLLPLPNWV